MPDKDAEEINRLHRQACGLPAEKMRAEDYYTGKIIEGGDKPRSVTYIRHLSGKMSGSRNLKRDSPDKYPEGTCGWHWAQPQSGDVCYYCRQRFSPDQMRFRIMEGIPGGWGPALICMDCFKSADNESTGRAARHTVRCPGCNEYINTIRNPRHQQWGYCSNRCYSRVYRKRRRGLKSVVEWKDGQPRCKCCRKYFKPSRTDAVYCSSACRQWNHRRRVWAKHGRNSEPRKRRRNGQAMAKMKGERR